MNLLCFLVFWFSFISEIVCFSNFSCYSVPKEFGVCVPVDNLTLSYPVLSLHCDLTRQEYCSEKYPYSQPEHDTTDFPLYILLDSLPVLILVPLILFFNIDLASGPGHSLVFAYQVLVSLSGVVSPNCSSYIPSGCGYSQVLKWVQSSLLVSGAIAAFFTTPLQMMYGYNPSLTHYSLGYVKVLIAGVLVAVSFFLSTCTQCPLQCCRGPWAKLRRAVRNWREKHLPQRPVLTGVCSVAILMYGNFVAVSFRLFYRQELLEKVCDCQGLYDFFSYNYAFCSEHTGSSDAFCWNSTDYWLFFGFACFFTSVAVLLSLPFFYHPGVPALASYLTRGRVQLPRLHKLAPLFDVFQGVYKPKMQFFTGLHLLYRIALWSAAAFPPSNLKIYILLPLTVVILAIHSLFQPFESRRHNYVETLLMVNVVLITVLYSNGLHLFQILLSMCFALTYLPLLCVIIYYTYKLIRRCCCCSRRREYHEIQAQDEVEEDGDRFQGERWEPPQDEAFH